MDDLTDLTAIRQRVEAALYVEEVVREALIRKLIVEHHFTDVGARKCMSVFIESLKFVGLWDEWLARQV